MNRTCKVCAVEKPLIEFVRSKEAQVYVNCCRECRNMARKNQRQGVVKSLLLQKIAAEYEAREKGKSTPPRTFVANGSYQPEPGYYRNDGLKHVKSFGYRT
jgi:hypothetical protein